MYYDISGRVLDTHIQTHTGTSKRTELRKKILINKSSDHLNVFKISIAKVTWLFFSATVELVKSVSASSCTIDLDARQQLNGRQ